MDHFRTHRQNEGLNDNIEVREAEPSSHVQFVVGRDHTAHGRGRHPWLTGTAGWAYHAATQWILGIRPAYEGLEIDPCISSTWPGFKVTRSWRGSTYTIDVDNSAHVEKGIQSVLLNGIPVRGSIPAQPAGSINKVAVVMG